MKRAWPLALLLGATLLTSARAGSEPPTGAAPLRQWTEADGWKVMLIRVQTGAQAGQPACLNMHGYDTTRPPHPVSDYRLWGLRANLHELMLIVNAGVEQDVSAEALNLSIDDFSLGHFRVTGRPLSPPKVPVHTAIVAVTDPALLSRLVGLLHTGAAIKIEAGGAPFEAKLSPVAAANFSGCLREAALLAGS